MLGRGMPGYYRSVFRGGHDPRFDPVSVGVGQGVTQGAAGGVAAGLALIAMLCWRDVRARREIDQPAAARQPSRRGALARVLLVFTFLAILILCSGVALTLGAIAGEQRTYHRRYLEEHDIVAPLLAADPSFSAIEMDERSNGGVYLAGEVPSTGDMERLRAEVTRALGEKRAEQVLIGVGVRR